MTDKITLEEALQLVFFIKDNDGKWCVGSVRGDVGGNVRGHVHGDVGGNVYGTISGKKWTYIETPREKLARLIKEKDDQELIKAFNELEGAMYSPDLGCDFTATRRALERLQELEGQSND